VGKAICESLAPIGVAAEKPSGNISTFCRARLSMEFKDRDSEGNNGQVNDLSPYEAGYDPRAPQEVEIGWDMTERRHA
jgi:hypothetical protein